MCLDVGKYRRIFCPRDPFELLPRKIIEQMIRGFFYRIRKGVTLLWSEYDAGTGEYSVKDDRIDPFDYTKKEDRQFFNHVCWEYRAKCGAEKCRNEDICITGAYLNGEMDGFRRYPCWLGMEDQAYGLKIGAHVRAVVFAGQIVPVEKERYREVQKRIHKYAPSHLVPSLIKLLCNERKRQQQRAGDYAESLRERLCEFAGMLQEILTRLYEARREAATRELLQASEEYLASAGFDDYDAWWDKCARLTQSFSELVGLIRIGILTRAGGYYRTRVPQGVVDPHIAVRDVLSMTAGQLMAATFDDSTARLAEKLALQPDNAAFFVSHAHTGVVPLSTLLFLEGGPSLEFKELTTEFCRIVAQHVDFFSLVAWQRQSQETYRVTVAQVAHDFRTPLQLVVCDLEDVAKL
jgi:hypothetical protein